MANIPIPQQGQPIDYQYIYQIVENLNELSTKVTSKFSESKFQNIENVKETRRMNDLSLVAGYTQVVVDKDVTSSKEFEFTYNFDVNFKYVPVVTVTPVMITTTEAGKDVSVVISSVTKSQVKGFVAFNAAKKGKASVGVNIIAVGIPEIPA